MVVRSLPAAAAAAAAATAAAVFALSACTSSAVVRDAPGTDASGGPASTTSRSAPRGPAYPDWPAYHGDAARSGLSTSMPAVRGTPRVSATIRLDAAAYAQPIVARGLTIVATENDSVYAFDAANHRVWHVRLGRPSPAGERPCGNIDPFGITGAPVYSNGLVYVAAEYGGPPRHELVALEVATGTVRWRRNLDLPGADPAAMQERGALAVADGRIWVPFGGLAGDCGDYKGRVVAFALNGSGAPLSYTVPTAREAGIWAPPGPVVAADGRLFVAVGNGAAVHGAPYDHSDSVLELDRDARLLDSFSPASWAQDNAADLDLGSQGPALVGKWIFAAGKSGTAYVLRQARLGGIGGEVSQATECRSFGGTAVVGDVVYVPCTDGVRAVQIDEAGRLHMLWHADGSISGSPVVGGGRVWSLDVSAGVLHALDPATGRSMAQVAVGQTTRFATPALSGNRVLVATLAGLTVVTTS
ncbi:MAG: PQQ-binding-like beta-propeller repeat protein [Jatrophihabitantaceae bacterium]